MKNASLIAMFAMAATCQGQTNRDRAYSLAADYSINRDRVLGGPHTYMATVERHSVREGDAPIIDQSYFFYAASKDSEIVANCRFEAGLQTWNEFFAKARFTGPVHDAEGQRVDEGSIRALESDVFASGGAYRCVRKHFTCKPPQQQAVSPGAVPHCDMYPTEVSGQRLVSSKKILANCRPMRDNRVPGNERVCGDRLQTC